MLFSNLWRELDGFLIYKFQALVGNFITRLLILLFKYITFTVID